MDKVKALPGDGRQEIIDQAGQVAEERIYATWGELCEPPAIKDQQLPSGSWISYRPWIPLDKFAEIQRKARIGNKGNRMDEATFMTLILQEVMIRPKIKTPQDFRSAKAANSNVMLSIINETVDTTMFNLEDTEVELGEA